MKILKALIFLNLFFYALHLNAADIAISSNLNSLAKIDATVESIKLKFSNPLRDINDNLESYELLLKTFDEFKQFDIVFTNGLLQKVRHQNTLSGEELFLLRRMMTTYYGINKKILDFAKVYDFGGFQMSKTFASNNSHMPLIKAHLIWLSGHLLVLEHLETLHHILYIKDDTFRRIVKNALLDKSSNGENTTRTLNDLLKISNYTKEIGESIKFSQQIMLVRAIEADLLRTLENEYASKNILITINANRTSKEIAQGKRKFNLANFTFIDSVANIIDDFTNWLSKTFGNIAGSIKWRKGHLYKNQSALEMVTSQLRPMDILLEKSPFVLTDKFIPGHYGHAAVYLGTKTQLEAIGMWNHPDLIQYHDQIESGKTILEAVRTGTRLNSVEEFLNIDEITIVRKKNGLSNPELLIEEITRGMDQIGKEYDFNFDITTLDKIVCSELVYIVFGNVHWPTQYRFGRATITPDDLAEVLFQRNTQFEIQQFLVSKEDHRIEVASLDYLTYDLNYEKRANDGTPIKNPNDPTNNYWKKEEKCYIVGDETSGTITNPNKNTRECKTSYKEFYYEERNLHQL